MQFHDKLELRTERLCQFLCSFSLVRLQTFGHKTLYWKRRMLKKQKSIPYTQTQLKFVAFTELMATVVRWIQRWRISILTVIHIFTTKELLKDTHNFVTGRHRIRNSAYLVSKDWILFAKHNIYICKVQWLAPWTPIVEKELCKIFI